MNEKRKKVLETLDKMEVSYEITEHPPVHTIEEMEQLGICSQGTVAKNLFLRNGSGKVHYLVVVIKEKQVDLVDLRQKLQCSRLSFGSPERLEKQLGISPGEVGPMGVLNNDGSVIVVFDKDLVGNPRIGCHPNDNTATIWLPFSEIQRVVKSCGNQMIYLSL